MSNFQIAIDGPVSVGKGTVSKLVSDRLGLVYVDTGAMYRMTAYLGLENNVDLSDEDKLVTLIKNSQMDMRSPEEDEKDGRLVTVLLNGEDVSWKIRTEEVSLSASKVASLPLVRKELVKKQQEIATARDVIMEGRDITTVVLPDADIRIYLDASDTVRAKRRQLQLQMRGEDISYEEVMRDLKKRDIQDTTRKTDPLVKAAGVWVINTSDLSIEQVVEMICNKAKLKIDN